jgi:hypothetical protein
MADGADAGINPDEIREQMHAAVERVREKFGQAFQLKQQTEEKPEEKRVEQEQSTPAGKS